MKRLALTFAAALLATQAAGQEFIVGLGYSDYSDGNASDATAIDLEYHLKPFDQRGNFTIGLGGVLAADSEENVFFGVGLVNKYQFNENWFAELTFMPGAFFEGSSNNDLGQTLEFRSLLAFGYRFNPKSAISLGFQHKSNAALSSVNPGVNTLTVRYHHSF
ncbi:acyloxyacyl hydrolase [Shimia abyssi]|uniref:Lipid A 3-O-deacylase PagL n=1 Tax=Shimia abyssi TaxID=1662395 RepID=A0A2P8FDK1_9RHOB|nr:acyloxyacyl hydrolase [Shimia abyssi]PSL19748.1 lipid A 3-O-deacylase PagL [Shimia abyssi]